MRDLKFVDEAYRAERKAAGPTEGQIALAETLDEIGNWPMFVTFTFRPNRNEEVIQNEEGAHIQNPRLRWCGGEQVTKRVTRNGAHVRGSRSAAPGWSSDQAMKIINRFIMQSSDLSKSRWFACVEPHKFRDCYHGHGLFANAIDANWEAINADWGQKHGRFRLEKVHARLPMQKYLAKQYVGKEYGGKDFRFSFSRNCRRPVQDVFTDFEYAARMKLFYHSFGGCFDRAAYARIRNEEAKVRRAA